MGNWGYQPVDRGSPGKHPRAPLVRRGSSPRRGTVRPCRPVRKHGTASDEKPRWRCGYMQHERAGTPAGPEDLVDVARLVTAYYALHPDPAEPGQRVAFGTSGHRGSSLATAFNEDHIAA